MHAVLHPLTVVVVASAALLLTGCGQNEPVTPTATVAETFPVTGHVHVDGQPANKVLVTCHNVDEASGAAQQTIGLTDETGKLEFSTYQSGDGVPAGNYVLTFTWGEWDDYWKRFSGPDKLNSRYLHPKQSKVAFTVKPGEPVDLGTIELTTK